MRSIIWGGGGFHNYNVFFQCIFVYFRCLLLSKWITEKTWEMLVMQRMMTLLASQIKQNNALKYMINRL